MERAGREGGSDDEWEGEAGLASVGETVRELISYSFAVQPAATNLPRGRRGEGAR